MPNNPPTPDEEEFAVEWRKFRGDDKPRRFAHYCYDWDGLPVDENCDEWTSCYCGFVDETGKKVRDRGSVFTIELPPAGPPGDTVTRQLQNQGAKRVDDPRTRPESDVAQPLNQEGR